jgi:hypothetical protein
MDQQSQDAPPKGYLKFFHAIALIFLGLAVVWALFWAAKWEIAPAEETGSMPEELLAIEVGSFLLLLLAVFFTGVQVLWECFFEHR